MQLSLESSGLTASAMPSHIGFILDGNRRWSKAHNKRFPWIGHRFGAKKLEEALEWCLKLGVKQVSVYTLSSENLNRSEDEVKELFDLYYNYLKKWEKGKGGILDKYEVKVRFIGDLSKLPPRLRKITGRIMEKTAKYQKYALNLMVAYSSQFELTETMKKIARQVLKSGQITVTQKDVEKNLMVPAPVDLIIRTGGMNRLSNFMLWQSAYSEIYVTKTLWPDLKIGEFVRILHWYGDQKRNFGR
jgi:undecaprenyl diphosphate synthase